MSITFINDVRDGFPETQEIGIDVVAGPANEPVSSEELQAQGRIDYTGGGQDSLIASYISAARQRCEAFCNRTFPTQTLRMTLDHFPFDGAVIRLRRPPVQEVSSIRYIDASGDWQSLDPDQFVVDFNSVSPRITPAPNCYWPTTQDRIAAVEIIYVAGYPDDSSGSTVPESVRSAILLIAAGLWEGRSEITDRPLSQNPNVSALLYPYRTF